MDSIAIQGRHCEPSTDVLAKPRRRLKGLVLPLLRQNCPPQFLSILAIILLSAGCSNPGSIGGGSGSSGAAGTSLGATGGTPTTSSTYTINLISAGPSINGSSGQELDLRTNNAQISQFCPATENCVCQFRYTEPGTTSTLTIESDSTYVENDLLRCSYGLVPSNVSEFRVLIRVKAGNLISNTLTISRPRIDTGSATDNPNNYLPVTRFQCKDVITQNTRFYQGTLFDPQSRLLSYSFNLYTTSLGRDFGGATAGYECPTSVPDSSLVSFSQDRYWPSNQTGPSGWDPDGWTTSPTTVPATLSYNPLGPIFKSGTNGLADDEPYDLTLYSSAPLRIDLGGSTAHYDNVIYPSHIDQGAPTSAGIDNGLNGASCTTGTDSSTCACVTGSEVGCRKFKANRHDFYVANFADNTFRQPFCVNHSVGGLLGENSLTKAQLDCSSDPTANPPVKGKDVLGYVALPDSNGSCPRGVNLPAGKKWGLLWKFSRTFEVRRLIDVANSSDIGNLYCTGPRTECTTYFPLISRPAAAPFLTDTNANDATIQSCTTTSSPFVTPASGGCDKSDTNRSNISYCQLTRSGQTGYPASHDRADSYYMGVLQFSSVQGQMYGNCLEVGDGGGQTGNISGGGAGHCRSYAGETPYRLANYITSNGTSSLALGNVNPDNVAVPTPYAPATPAGQTGCFDPIQTYLQKALSSPFLSQVAPSLASEFTGFFNVLLGTASGCYSWHTTNVTLERRNGIAIDTANFNSYDWQGFPFMAGDYTSNIAGAPREYQGVGFGGNFCNPTLPGSRWSGQRNPADSGTALVNPAAPGGQIGTQMAGGYFYPNTELRAADPTANRAGWGDGIDVWLVSSSGSGACIEADTDAEGRFLYNEYAHFFKSPYKYRLPGSSVDVGFPGMVKYFPKTIKNWFDFVGIGCKGRCDNSDSNNSYPSLFRRSPGRGYQEGEVATTTNSQPVPAYAWRTGPHSSTTSFGGYGVFTFTTQPIESTGKKDHLYIVSPEGISPQQMRDPAIQNMYRPVRYINGVKVEYDAITDSSYTDSSDQRLSQFPVCVLQDDGTTP